MPENHRNFDEIFNLVKDYHLLLPILCDLFILLCYIKKRTILGHSILGVRIDSLSSGSHCHFVSLSLRRPHRNNGENYQCFLFGGMG